jgi:UDP-glucose 4-epimerase
MGVVIPLVRNDAVIVTGANGYIGAQLCKRLIQEGKQVIGLDLAVCPRHKYTSAYLTTNYGDTTAMRELIDQYQVKTIYHVAATSLVEPSMTHPTQYYSNNVGSMANMLTACINSSVERIVFSSSAAVYGDCRDTHGICNELAIPAPVNPYGHTKRIGEQLLWETRRAHGINYVSLRYFNVAGADSVDNDLGQVDGAAHVLPKIMEAVRQQKQFTIYGNDYKTPDKTAVRDYVHVEDVVEANLKANQYIKDGGEHEVFNIGSGQGTSVKEIFDTTCDVLKINISCDSAPRRPGDPPVLVADVEEAFRHLDWQPTRNLRQIIEDANNWYNYQTIK